MVKFINRITGNAMFVAEDRVEEYKALGHKLAVSKPAPAVKTTPAQAKKPTAKKTKPK